MQLFLKDFNDNDTISATAIKYIYKFYEANMQVDEKTVITFIRKNEIIA